MQCETLPKQEKILHPLPVPIPVLTSEGEKASAHSLIAEVKEDPSELQIKSEVFCQLTPNRLFQVFVMQRM